VTPPTRGFGSALEAHTKPKNGELPLKYNEMCLSEPCFGDGPMHTSECKAQVFGECLRTFPALAWQEQGRGYWPFKLWRNSFFSFLDVWLQRTLQGSSGPAWPSIRLAVPTTWHHQVYS